MLADLSLIKQIARAEHGLAVVSTVRLDGTVQSSVVNAAVTAHPVNGQPILAFVARGRSHKLDNLRRTRRATLVLRRMWDWVGVEGDVDLAGPDDDPLGLGPDRIRLLLRQIFLDAGGRHPDLREYDRVMLDERRTGVLIRIERAYTNPSHARHIET